MNDRRVLILAGVLVMAALGNPAQAQPYRFECLCRDILDALSYEGLTDDCDAERLACEAICGDRFLDFVCPARPEINCDGPHWVDICGPAIDRLDSQIRVEIDLSFDCLPDFVTMLPGRTFVRTQAPSDDSANYPGLRPHDGHLDVMDTELLWMRHSDGTTTLVGGRGSGQGPGLRPSLGAAAELTSSSTRAQSFFDVFFEVSRTDQQMSLYNQQPVRVQAVIDQVPPTALFGFTGCVPLYTSPIPGQGQHVANLVRVEHGVIPVDVEAGAIGEEVALESRSMGPGSIEIRYRIPRAGTAVHLAVYDVAGRMVRLLDAGVRDGGEHVRTWDERDASGVRLSRGVYVLQLRAGETRVSKKIVIVNR